MTAAYATKLLDCIARCVGITDRNNSLASQKIKFNLSVRGDSGACLGKHQRATAKSAALMALRQRRERPSFYASRPTAEEDFNMRLAPFDRYAGLLLHHLKAGRTGTVLAALTAAYSVIIPTYVNGTELSIPPIESGSFIDQISADSFVAAVMKIAETYDMAILLDVVKRSLNVSLERDASLQLIKGREEYLATAKGFLPEVSIAYDVDMIHVNIGLLYSVRFPASKRTECLKSSYVNSRLTAAGWIGHSMPIIGDLIAYTKDGYEAFIQTAQHGGPDPDKTCIEHVAIRFRRATKQ